MSNTVDTQPRTQFRSGDYLDAKLEERAVPLEDERRKKISKDTIAKRDLTRWYDALEENRITFTLEEAILLCDCLNGVSCTAGTLYGNIYCAEELETSVFDGDALLDRIRTLETMQAWYVIDAVERAWNAPTYGNIDLKKRVMLVGLVK